MANVLNLLSEETFREQMNVQNTLLSALAGVAAPIIPKTPLELQAVARAGMADKIFSIGEQIACQKGSTTLIWDIIGIDRDTPSNKNLKHSLTLQLHDCFASMQFDSREALFYVEQSMPAGTYNFTVTQHTWVSGDVGKTFQFTLTQAVPAGGQIALTTTYNVSIAGSTVNTYASATATIATETATVTEGSEGTSLGDVNNAVNGNTNSLQRSLLGSNNYAESAMRQYLNSTAAAGSVWTPQTMFDRPPSWATTTAGFLNGIDEDFLSVIGEVDKITNLNTISDGGGSVITSERFFLLSRSEVYGGNENNINEGAAYPYYSENSDLSAPGMAADTNRIKYLNNTAQHWWLRSPYTGYAYGALDVFTAGDASNYFAGGSSGVAPACCIV